MRPTRAFLAVALALFALSVPAAAVEDVPAQLVVALWLVLAVALALDMVITPSRRHLALRLSGPVEVFTGEETALTLEIDGRRRLPGEIGCRLVLPEEIAGPEESTLRTEGRAATLAIPIRAKRRGTWDVKALWLAWPSRFGLLQFTPRYRTEVTLRAVPNVRPIQSGELDIQIRSELFGMRPNVLRGEGSEFHQLRDFTTGMDPRTIDWKHSARHRTLLAKEMRTERNHHIILALDNGGLMREEIAGLPKIDHAVNAALVTAWAAILGGDLVGLYAFDSRPRVFLPPEGGRLAFSRLRSRSAELDYRVVESNHTLGLTHLHGRLKRRALIVVFSDFVDTTTAELLVENVTVLARHHVMIFVALRDPVVESLAQATPDTLTDVANAVAAAAMLRERRMVLERLSRIGVFCIDTRPEGLTAELLSTYLRIKARELI